MTAASVKAAIHDAQAAADELLLHLQLASAASFGPAAVIDAAMADVAARADALAAVVAARPDQAGELTDARTQLATTVEAIEREAQALALELARRRTDIDEVLRHAAGSPGIYDASGRTAPGAPRRPRGTG